MDELKPCKCGSVQMDGTFGRCGLIWICLIGCMDFCCDVTVIRYGLTKKQSMRRAVRAWNRRAEDEK